MADEVVIEFIAKSDRFKRDLDSIERDAKRAAAEINRSFRNAAREGFGVDPRVARQQNLAAERDINRRLLEDRRESDRAWVDSSISEQQRLATRTRVYTERRRDEWEQAEERRGRATAKAREITGQALTAAAGALRVGISLAREYAEKWEYANSVMARTNAGVDRLKSGIGRDLVFAFDALSPAIEKLETARSGVVNLLASIATLTVDKGKGVDRELDRAEGLERNRVQTDTLRQEELRQLAGGGGPGADAARDALARREYAERINALVEEGRLSGSQASGLISSFDPAAGRRADTSAGDRQRDLDRRSRRDTARREAETRDRRLFGDSTQGRIAALNTRADFEASGLDQDLSPRERAAAERAIYAERDRAIEEELRRGEERRQQEADRRREALESYSLREREARVDELIGQGKRREGEVLREQVRLEREIVEIKRDQRLTDEDRVKIIEQAQRRSGARIERIKEDDAATITRSLAGGTVTALTRQTVLGGGRSIETIAARQLGEAEKQTALLATIAENGSGGVL